MNLATTSLMESIMMRNLQSSLHLASTRLLQLATQTSDALQTCTHAKLICSSASWQGKAHESMMHHFEATLAILSRVSVTLADVQRQAVSLQLSS